MPDRSSGGIAYSPEGPPAPSPSTLWSCSPRAKGPPIPDDVAAKLSIRLFSTLFSRSRVASQTELDPSPHESLASWLYAPSSPLFDGVEPEWRDVLKQMVGMFDGWTGAALEDVSLRWWGFEQEFEGADAVVRDGYHRFVDVMAKELGKNGVKVSLRREVVGVKFEEEDEMVTIAHRAVGTSDTADDSTETTTASHVICTLPLGVLRSLPPTFFSPPLPPRRRSSLDKLGFGLLNKVILSYEAPFWPSDPTWFQFLPRVEDRDDPVLGKTMGAQNQLAISGTPVLVFFGGAGLGEALEAEDPVELEKRLRGKLAFHLGKEVPRAKKCIVTKWRSDPWAKGSYAFIPVGREGEASATPLDLLELSKPLWEGRLGFAGEATSVDHFGPFSPSSPCSSTLTAGPKLPFMDRCSPAFAKRPGCTSSSRPLRKIRSIAKRKSPVLCRVDHRPVPLLRDVGHVAAVGRVVDQLVRHLFPRPLPALRGQILFLFFGGDELEDRQGGGRGEVEVEEGGPGEEERRGGGRKGVEVE